MHSGFYIGLALGLVAVVAVVVMVARILLYASRIANHADMRNYVRRLLADEYEVLMAADGTEALEVVRKSTDVLPEARHINEHAQAILQGAQIARGALTG